MPSMDRRSKVADMNTEEDKCLIWGRVIDDWEKTSKTAIDELVTKGVPHPYRPIVWQLLCGTEKLPENKRYREYMSDISPDEAVIRKDINRTYPQVKYFQNKHGQEALFRVIKAYSLHDAEVGYCQGSAFPTALLLMHMSEEEAFTVMLKIMEEHNMRLMYKAPLNYLMLCMYQLECMVKETLPTLYAHFVNENMLMITFSSNWFLTIFSTTLSIKASCRIMDVFLLRGTNFIFQFAVAVLTVYEKDLLRLDIEQMQSFLKRGLKAAVDEDIDVLIASAISFTVDPEKMTKFSEEFKSANEN